MRSTKPMSSPCRRHGAPGDYALRHDGINLEPEPPEPKWRQPFNQTPLAKLLGISRALDVEAAIERVTAGEPAGQQAGPAVTLSGLLQAWASEREPPARTLDAWTRIINRLIKHIGHEDPERLMRRDLIGWKDLLLASGLARRSVEVHLAAVSTIFNHALLNDRLIRTDNPAKGRSRGQARRSGGQAATVHGWRSCSRPEGRSE